MPTALSAKSSLPLSAEGAETKFTSPASTTFACAGRTPRSNLRATPATLSTGSLSRVHNLSERRAPTSARAAAAASPPSSSSASAPTGANLAACSPKQLRFAALNRSFHNATHLAAELRDSLSQQMNQNNSGGGVSATSSASLANADADATVAAAAAADSSTLAAKTVVRHFSLRVKEHVKASLSEPLRRRASSRRERVTSTASAAALTSNAARRAAARAIAATSDSLGMRALARARAYWQFSVV